MGLLSKVHGGLPEDSENWAVIDVETTGLARHSYVVEFACEILNFDGKVIGQYETLIRPPRGHVGPEHLHGISPAMVERAPRFAEVARDIHDLICGRIPVAHNLTYDWTILRAEFARAGAHAPLHAGGVCTARIARRVLEGRSRLDDVCRSLGIPRAARHQAASDVRATSQALMALLPRLDRAPLTTHCRPFHGASRLTRPTEPLPRPEQAIHHLSARHAASSGSKAGE